MNNFNVIFIIYIGLCFVGGYAYGGEPPNTKHTQYKKRMQKLESKRVQGSKLKNLARKDKVYRQLVKPQAILPKDVGLFPDDLLQLDGTGTIVKVRRPPTPKEMKDLERVLVDPLTKTNSPHDRTVPKTESEIVISMVHALRHSDIPEAKSVAKEFEELWFLGKVNTKDVKALLVKTKKALPKGNPLQSLVDKMLVESDKKKTLMQYQDNGVVT